MLHYCFEALYQRIDNIVLQQQLSYLTSARCEF